MSFCQEYEADLVSTHRVQDSILLIPLLDADAQRIDALIEGSNILLVGPQGRHLVVVGLDGRSKLFDIFPFFC